MTFKVGDLVCIKGTPLDNEHAKKFHGMFATIVLQAHIRGFDSYRTSPATNDCGYAIYWTADALIKIDPPAEGETREAYKNLKVPA